MVIVEGVCSHDCGYVRCHIHVVLQGEKLMFLDKDALLEVASIVADGFIFAAIIVGMSIILAKVVEVFGVRRVFTRKRR